VKLVDTSSWVHLLRRGGDRAIAERVQFLLSEGEAAWCEMVRLELWNGVGSELDRKNLRALERALPMLPITDEVWDYRVALPMDVGNQAKQFPRRIC
jgi:predicted nucleic acid-binding protein